VYPGGMRGSMTGMTELLVGVLRVPISVWATLVVTGLLAWLSLLAAMKAEQRVGDGRRPIYTRS
jgi:hypothetical protein